MRSDIAIIGAGIAGITTAYALAKKGHKVTLIDSRRYPAMATSYANGGQLSASNSETWNTTKNILNGIKWMFKKDAPLLFNPSPSIQKYKWMIGFLLANSIVCWVLDLCLPLNVARRKPIIHLYF